MNNPYICENNYSDHYYSNYSNLNDCYYNQKQEFKKSLRRKRIIRHNIRAAIFLTLITTGVLFLTGSLLKKAIKQKTNETNSVMTMNYDVGTFSGGDDYYFDAYENSDKSNNDYDSEIPNQLIDFMERRPETTNFVMSYPEKHDVTYYIDLSGEVTDGEIPLFIQWDERWGYKQYGDDFFALNGCAPTCLSMICLGLGGDTKYDPYTVGQIMDNNGYYEYGVGSKWSVMTEGAELIGLDGEEIPLDEYVIKNKLNNGCPIICSMGEGDFTSSGHFIVLTGVAPDGSITVNDPCSRINSEKTWELSRLMPQIKNLWAFSIK